jgi:hypothetical protein
MKSIYAAWMMPLVSLLAHCKELNPSYTISLGLVAIGAIQACVASMWQAWWMSH